MILDVSIILAYFTAIMAIGVRARVRKDVRTEEYFLSARSLKWPAIAMSTVATNIQANHFISMAGSASPDGQESPPCDYLVRVMMAPMSAAIPPAVITIPIVCIWERLRPGSQ